MEERLAKLQAKIEADKGLGEKLFSMENAQDVQSLLKGEGLEFSLEEIAMLRDALVKVLAKGSDELSDEDLENVAGGILVTTIVAIIGAIAGAISVAGTVTDQAVRSRW